MVSVMLLIDFLMVTGTRSHRFLEVCTVVVAQEHPLLIGSFVKYKFDRKLPSTCIAFNGEYELAYALPVTR